MYPFFPPGLFKLWAHRGSDVRQAFWFATLVLAGMLPIARQTCPSGQPRTENALLQLERSWAKALELHDSATVACLIAQEFEDAGVDGELHDRADTLARIPHRRPSHNQLTELRVRVYGDFAFVRGLNRVTDNDGKLLAQVRFTDIFVYRDGRWQAVAGQETLVNSQKQ